MRNFSGAYFATCISSFAECLLKSFVKFLKYCVIYLRIELWEFFIYSESVPLRGRCFANSLWLVSFPNSECLSKSNFKFGEAQFVNIFMVYASLLLLSFSVKKKKKKSLANLRPQKFSPRICTVLDVLHMVWGNVIYLFFSIRGSFCFCRL